MSSALGQCRFSDGLVMYFEYNGTVDVCCLTLRETAAEVWNHWRAGFIADYTKIHMSDTGSCDMCQCGRSELVELADDHGGGKHWTGKACRHCKTITGKACPYGLDSPTKVIENAAEITDGTPSWWVTQ